MSSLVDAELLKLRTTRTWIGVALTLVLVAGAGAAASVGSAPDADLGTVDLTREVLSASLFGGFFAFLLGITMVTSEWRHGTITRTFLVTPRRVRVLVAKELTAGVVGVMLALVGIATVLAVGGVWHVVESSSLGFDTDIVEELLTIVVAGALWGALGVGVGATIQSQTPALVAAIVWLLIGEALAGALLGTVDLERIADFFPGAALGAFEGSVDDALPAWAGGIVGVGWVVGLGVLGSVRLTRRDVT